MGLDLSIGVRLVGFLGVGMASLIELELELRTNTSPYGTRASASDRSGRACLAYRGFQAQV